MTDSMVEMTGELRRKCAWPFWVGAVGTAAGGAIWFCVSLLALLSSLDEGASRFRVPGREEVRLDEAGTYTVYHEYQSVLNGRVYSTFGKSFDMACRAWRKDDPRTRITFEDVGASMTYSTSGRSGRAVFTFDVVEPGVYVFDVESSVPTVLVVRPGSLGSMVMAILRVVAIPLGCGSAVIFLLVFAILRTLHNRKIARQQHSPSWVPSSGEARP